MEFVMAKGYFQAFLRVPLKDVDGFKTVWYGNYLAYFDVARTEMFRHFGLAPSELYSLGYYAPVVNAKVDYYCPARNDDEIVVEVRPKLHRTAKITFLFRVLRREDERLLATGETTHVLESLDGVLLYRVPPALADKMKKILGDLGGAEEDV